MNVGFEDYNTTDVATILGVQKCTVSYWCRNGYIRFQDVSSAKSEKPRYMFTVDEVERVSKLIEKYGKNAWTKHADEGITNTSANKIIECSTSIDDETEELTKEILRIKALKKQREKLLNDLDNIDNAIKAMREKILQAI